MKKKIGVYVCHCGGNISDYVDIQKVKDAVKDEANVYLLKNTLFACSDSSQKEMVDDIQTSELDAIVVASCSPKLHVPTFRAVAERAGMNAYNYVQVNIREQSSWAHSDNKLGATEKAILLVKAGIARASESEALTSMKIPTTNAVAIIGAGVGGMRSAIALADMGSEVYLIEKEATVGGHVAEIGELFTSRIQGKDLVENLLSEIKKRSNIKLFTSAELAEKKGSIGNFDIKVNVGGETLPLHIGAFIVNTGFDSYTPATGEYGFGEMDNVITLPTFKKLIDSSHGVLEYNGKPIKRIAYIYCVGSRQDEEGENKYCSRYCCTAAIHVSILAKNKFKGITNLHFNRGIRAYGKQELLYAESSKMGDIYLQFSLDSIPQLVQKGNKTLVSVKDILSAGRTVEAEADLVVLVTGMIPRKNDKLVHQLKIPVGRDRFFNEIHMKLRPVETVIDGVLIAGTCQSPKNILETVNSSMAAAAKANSILTKGEIALEPTLAMVNPAACVLCDKCFSACVFDAIVETEFEGRKVAKINVSNCKGCGMCTPVCPTDAIDLAGFTNAQIEGMVDALSES
ncbi:CoB--CoM heterodisulfide reductase iron-sulfur subunit A family protein [Williamwhitmania taraxaci]|uniref:Heterodisulfide reductase subunit A n=1 Tax=Williamwhitmania taraxaci TaxID=1640674 RepID=A0A1G6HG14_9BACT|nr:FAD-dependent oxidoreductase [Williamwhitmania taraxaci]SDB93180.1 heterodisulfide reductase subunit A [Williamwhitmania taraxaci]